MDWATATRLFFELVKDPSSHAAAAMAGWDRPVSNEWIALTDLIDVHRALNHDKRRGQFKPSPRPWPDPNTVRLGVKQTHSQEDIRAALAARAPVRTE